jgi:inward rectifier potassium channel
VDPQQLILIECHFELVYQRFLTLPGQPTPFITGVGLKLVRPRVPYLKYGLVIRHIIDETSPLYNMDVEVFNSFSSVSTPS